MGGFGPLPHILLVFFPFSIIHIHFPPPIFLPIVSSHIVRPIATCACSFIVYLFSRSAVGYETLVFFPVSLIPLIAFLLFFLVLRHLRFSSRIAILRACSSISIYLFDFVGVLGSGFAGARPPRFPPLLIFSLLHPPLPCFSSHRACADAFIYFRGGAVGSGVRW
jgi:hypothetical protein